MAVQPEEVMRWVAEYERAWREEDVDGVARLFTDDAHYRASPYEPAKVGHAAIEDFWLADQGADFTMTATPIAVQDSNAVVRVEVLYTKPRRQDYRDLWVLQFAADGRVEDFEEWAYWPGRGYSAEQDA